MYHGDTNERQHSELHMLRKEGGKRKMAVNRTSTSVFKEGIDHWLLAVTSDPAAKRLAKDLEAAGAGPVHCHFPFPSFFPYHV